jgi:hypothetical protein
VGSQAKPRRGPNWSSWFGILADGSLVRPPSTGKVKLRTWLTMTVLVASGVGLKEPSQRSPALTVKFGRTFQLSWAKKASSSVE